MTKTKLSMGKKKKGKKGKRKKGKEGIEPCPKEILK